MSTAGVVAGSGVTSVGGDSADSGNFQRVTVLPLTGERMGLILHVANFHHYKGGIWNSIMSRRTIKLLNTVERQTVERGEFIEELTEAHRNFTVSRLVTILGLAKLAEYRDSDTGFHLERIREYSCILTRCLTDHPKYKDYINDINHPSILHDIGKVWVKD